MFCMGTEILREDAKSLGSEMCERKVFCGTSRVLLMDCWVIKISNLT